MSSEPVFKVHKRRKVVRRPNTFKNQDVLAEDMILRSSVSPQASLLAPKDEPNPAQDPENQVKLDSLLQENSRLQVDGIVRRYDLVKARRGGIKFTNTPHPLCHNSVSDKDARPSFEKKASAIEAASGRFAPQTGVVVETLNKHMMAYVDSEMVKVHQNASPFNGLEGNSTEIPAANTEGISSRSNEPIQRQPAALGKLQEIDLGPDAARRNIERTEAATRRLNVPQSVDGSATDAAQQPVRFGRDGKPRPPSKWKTRRTSDDVKRDEMVETLLKENKLDLYDDIEDRFLTTENPEGAADDIMADQFRQEFLDAIHSRQQAKRPPTGTSSSSASSANKPADILARGPKLGGSRSARAAMHRAHEEKMGKRR